MTALYHAKQLEDHRRRQAGVQEYDVPPRQHVYQTFSHVYMPLLMLAVVHARNRWPDLVPYNKDPSLAPWEIEALDAIATWNMHFRVLADHDQVW